MAAGLFSFIASIMPDGIGPKAGYDILVNGLERTFRDTQAAALNAAGVLKRRHTEDIVEIRDCSNGDRMLMLVDGRLG